MGGKGKTIYKPNKENKRVIAINEVLWRAVLELQERHLDEFPFSAREVIRHTGRKISHSLITRNRGGLKQFQVRHREDFVNLLDQLVEGEKAKHGDIDIRFCRNLTFLISSYHALFALDVISSSHCNTEFMIETIKPLIYKDRILFFGAEFYALLQDWHKEQFSRELGIVKYAKRIQDLMIRYQITRPDMTVTTGEDHLSKIFPDSKGNQQKDEGGHHE